MRFTFDGCDLDLDTRELQVGGDAVHIEPQVFDVLAYLIANRDRVVPKTELLDEIWGGQFVSESALTSRIRSARRAVGDDGGAQRLIRTQHGLGYRFVGDVAASQSSPGALVAIGSTRLPAAPRTRLIGRLDDIGAVDALLARYRIVTISGPGGAGKTTLALTIARRHGDDDGGSDVVYAELAPARDRAELLQAVAGAAGIEGPASGDVGQLAAIVGARESLLVLDNCEHLLEPASELVHAVLDAGSRSHVLTTSREPLGVDGEAIHPLGSLGRDAPELFVERAAAATGEVALAADDPVVVDMCERLDGLPLAIELAAAQLRHLDLTDLSTRLEDWLGILVGGRPRAGDRHAALASTIEWSYDLLSPESRALFDQLGVFSASFDLQGVEAVTELDPVAVTNGIADLVSKNLVVYDRQRGRYRLLETIRLFAGERLRDHDGLGDRLLERLRRNVVARATELPRPKAWLSASSAAALRDDIDNVRIAFEASVDAGEYGDAVDVALGLSSLWRNSASCVEGLRWAAALADQPLDDPDRLWLLLVRADLGLGAGDPRLMVGSAEAARQLGGDLGERAAVVIATIYRTLPERNAQRALTTLTTAAEEASAIDEPELERLARAFAAAAKLGAGLRDGLDEELAELTTSASRYGYDRYISIWATWVTALADRDGPRLRQCMRAQLDNVRTSGLQENWLTMFCGAVTLIGEGAEYLADLDRARRRAEDEGRSADASCVFAFAYAAACAQDMERAAELLGACADELRGDTANYLHYLIVRDLIVRPELDEATFDEALALGRDQTTADILAHSGL